MIRDLGNCAFGSCPSLRSIRIPSSIRAIHPLCFLFCNSQCTVILESGCQLSDPCLYALRSASLVTWAFEDR
jgi:hypothetical protein